MNYAAQTMNEERYLNKIVETDYNIDRLNKIRNFLPTSGKLLEIGAWDGTTIRHYKERFKGETFGIDMSERILKQAEPYFDQVKVCNLNNDKIPFSDSFFDVVVCGEIIEHILDTDYLLEEIHRVVNNEGIIIISTPNLVSFLNRCFLLFGFQPLCTEVSTRYSHYGNPFRKRGLIPAGHIRNFTYSAFCEIVEANGFVIKKRLAATMSVKKWINFIERITGKMMVSLGSDIVLVCKKIAFNTLS
jgi:ubiquinone/menaquinone biosynthesis C-methylase UbiE